MQLTHWGELKVMVHTSREINPYQLTHHIGRAVGKRAHRSMSGFEIAGVVLGSIPLLVTASEAYINFLRDRGKAPSELKSLNRRLTTERSKLYNVCDHLLAGVVPHQDIEPMLENPFGPLWQAKETEDRLRQRLWESYKPFQETALEVEGALRSVMQRLRVEVTCDGQAS